MYFIPFLIIWILNLFMYIQVSKTIRKIVKASEIRSKAVYRYCHASTMYIQLLQNSIVPPRFHCLYWSWSNQSHTKPDKPQQPVVLAQHPRCNDVTTTRILEQVPVRVLSHSFLSKHCVWNEQAIKREVGSVLVQTTREPRRSRTAPSTNRGF